LKCRPTSATKRVGVHVDHSLAETINGL
jgi:hypothetical protein